MELNQTLTLLGVYVVRYHLEQDRADALQERLDALTKEHPELLVEVKEGGTDGNSA